MSRLKEGLSELTGKCKPYLEALNLAPKAVKGAVEGVLERYKGPGRALCMRRVLRQKLNAKCVEKALKVRIWEGKDAMRNDGL